MTSTVRVRAAELEGFSTRLLAAKGLSAEHASCVAAALAWADSRGVASHGVAFLPIYARMLDAGTIARAALPSIAIDTPSLVMIDADRAPGAVAMRFAIDTAITRAQSTGLCAVWVRDTTHTGAVGYYAALAAARGFGAIVMNAGPPLMAYHGARVPSATTGPIVIAVPGADADPIVLDMATSVVAFSRLRAARQGPAPIPAGWAIAADGEPTTDPARAAVPLPLGGPKGAGLSLMFELMTSTLLACPILMEHLPAGGAQIHRQNAMMLVWNIAALRPLDAYRADVAILRDTLKGLPRAAGVDEILLPGERGARVRGERQRDGIPIPGAMWNDLAALAAPLGVALPAPITRA